MCVLDIGEGNLYTCNLFVFMRNLFIFRLSTFYAFIVSNILHYFASSAISWLGLCVLYGFLICGRSYLVNITPICVFIFQKSPKHLLQFLHSLNEEFTNLMEEWVKILNSQKVGIWHMLFIFFIMQPSVFVLTNDH